MGWVRNNVAKSAVEEADIEMRAGAEAEGAERVRGKNLRKGLGLRLRLGKR